MTGVQCDVMAEEELGQVERSLRPGPCWAFGGVLLDDGRLVVVDTFRGEVWEYTRAGTGRRVDSASGALPSPKHIQRSPAGALWLFGDGNFVELDEELRPRRSYAVWGRRDGSGRLLERVQQWTLVDDETVVALSFTGHELWVVRLVLTSTRAGKFEVLESIGGMEAFERRYFADGSPKLAVDGGGYVYILRLREGETVLRRVGRPDEVLVSFPGGRRSMEESGESAGDWFVGLSALGLVTVGEEVLVLRRRGGRYWLEDFFGLRWSWPRRSTALRVAPVVGQDTFGLLELGAGDHIPGERGAGLLWITSAAGGAVGGASER